MNKRLRIGLIIVLVVVAASELLLPSLVGRLVARGMVGATAAEEISAKVVKRPAVLMLGGGFDRVFIHAVNARIDKITFAELDTALENLDLDMAALITRRTVAVRSVQDIDLTAVISQEELSRFLNQNVKGVRNAVVTVNAGKVQVTSSFGLGSLASVAITLEGKVAGDGQKLKFVTERFLLNNTMVGNIGGSVLTEIPLVDLKKLPFGVVVRAVNMEDGKVTIFADNRTK
ncbi:MAG: LmeA family phospholipid-binding protein [Negativicutes bacterium]|nr:LmeA family phospholipid-binding protein [Negativicutes bacterium]